MTTTPTRSTPPPRPSAARRVVEPATEYSVPRLRLPDELPRGLLAGLEGMLGSWLVVVVPAVAAYVATVSAPALGEASWLDAARAGTLAWLLGLGTPLATDGVVVSVVPLGVTLLVALLLAASVRRARMTTASGGVSAVVGAGAVLAGAHVFAEVAPDARGVVVALAVVLGGTALGLARGGALAGILPIARIPGGVRAGLRLGGTLLLALATLGALLVVLAVAGAAGAVREVHDALARDVVSAVVLVLAQLLVWPTAAVWALSWLTGAGFTLGGASVSPTDVVAGPLPAVPALAALPEPGTAASSAGWALVVPVLLAAALAWRAERRTPTAAVRAVVLRCAVAVTVVALGCALAFAMAGGVVGPISDVGPPVTAATAGLTLQTACGVTLGVLAARGTPWVVARLAPVRARLSRRGAP